MDMDINLGHLGGVKSCRCRVMTVFLLSLPLCFYLGQGQSPFLFFFTAYKRKKEEKKRLSEKKSGRRTKLAFFLSFSSMCFFFFLPLFWY